MKCYTHLELDAVGICKACHKALCPACAKDLGHGLACIDNHQEEVEFLHTTIENIKTSRSSAPKFALIENSPYLLFGIIFLLVAWSLDSYEIAGLGAVFIIIWLGAFIYNSNYFKKIGLK